MKASVALVLALAVAGCFGSSPPPAEAPGPAPAPAPPAPGLSAHDGSGEVAVPAGWEALQVDVVSTGRVGGEPTVGVTSSGAIFLTAATPPSLPRVGAMLLPVLLRSRDGGETWTEVSDPVLGPKANGDPWVWVDPATDRVFDSNLYGGCSWLEWSDDEGETWEANPASGCGLPGQDFAKLTGGPPAAGVATDGYPSVLYNSYQSLPGGRTLVSASLDGGKTFGLPAEIHAQGCFGGLASPVAVAPDGTAFSARYGCEGVETAVSLDSGATWTRRALVDAAGEGHVFSAAPDVAVDDAGNAYLLFTGEDGLVRLAASRDGGATWGAPRLATPPGLTMTAFGAVAAGAPGRVAVAYLATRADPSGWAERRPSAAGPEADWHLFLARSDDALAADPVFVTSQATPSGDPVQRGCIAMWSQECSNLLDFIDVLEHGGRAYVPFTDGCVRCADAASSTASVVGLAWTSAGPPMRP